jgi:hypothetical protein
MAWGQAVTSTPHTAAPTQQTQSSAGDPSLPPVHNAQIDNYLEIGMLLCCVMCLVRFLEFSRPNSSWFSPIKWGLVAGAIGWLTTQF